MEFNFYSRSLLPAFCCIYLGSPPNSTRTPFTLSRDLTLRCKWGVDAPTCGFGLEGRMRREGWGRKEGWHRGKPIEFTWQSGSNLEFGVVQSER